MSPTREVVITGLGVVCPLGVGRDAFWEALREGRSGVSLSPLLGAGETPFRLGGYVTGFDPKEHIQPRKTIKVMCREIQFAFAAAGMAMADAALAKGQIEPNRFGVVLGSELLYGEVEELFATFRQCQEADGFHVERFAENAMKEIFPLWMLKYLPNMAACHIGIAHDARGPNNSIVGGAVSSLNAVYEACCYIQRGHADAMIAGGAGSLVSFNGFPFRGWKHLSKSRDPAEAPLPLDARRDGSLPGEGCGMLVLESREHAERRGAPILARIAGFASRYEPLAPGKAPSGSAIRASISAALAQAGLNASQIGCVSAAAGGDPLADAREAQAIRAELGAAPVTAVKGGMGDLGAGTGAVELAAAVLALHHSLAPPTAHFQTPDPNCPVQVVAGAAQPFTQPAVIKISHNPTGQAAALVVARN